MIVTDTTDRIRALNDQLRHENIQGIIVMTRGVSALPAELQREVFAALASFSEFGRDNDPHGEHDFGAFTVGGHRLFFKIDYYDRSGRHHSPDPADPSVMRRVLTLMLADEY
jgi:hypothetical protein